MFFIFIYHISDMLLWSGCSSNWLEMVAEGKKSDFVNNADCQ